MYSELCLEDQSTLELHWILPWWTASRIKHFVYSRMEPILGVIVIVFCWPQRWLPPECWRRFWPLLVLIKLRCLKAHPSADHCHPAEPESLSVFSVCARLNMNLTRYQQYTLQLPTTSKALDCFLNIFLTKWIRVMKKAVHLCILLHMLAIWK